MFRWDNNQLGFLNAKSVEEFGWAKHLFIEDQGLSFVPAERSLHFSLNLIRNKTLHVITHLLSAALLYSFSQMYNILWVALLRISITWGWPFISEADKDSRVLMRTSSVKSSGCDEPSEMSTVKNTMSFSLIKYINYANYFEKRLDTSPAESHDNLLMIQLFLIQFECLQLHQNI